MRFCVSFKLLQNNIPLDIRPVFLSFFKRALKEYDGGEYFDQYYSIGVKKPFTFAFNFGKCIFNKQYIEVPDKIITLNFSTSCSQTGIIFYNALLDQKGKKLPLIMGNEMVLTNIYIKKHKTIISEQVLCRFIAPLCIRKHNEDNRDYYFTWEDGNFSQEVFKIVKEQMKNNKRLSNCIDTFGILPVRTKKTVVKHHGQSIPVTIGTVILKGNVALLTELYLSGIGSRSSAGFGYFNIIGQGGR